MKYRQEEGYIILDVREQNEYDAGHIPGAIPIPYTKIKEMAATMLPDKDPLLLVYCRGGSVGRAGLYQYQGIRRHSWLAARN